MSLDSAFAYGWLWFLQAYPKYVDYLSEAKNPDNPSALTEEECTMTVTKVGGTNLLLHLLAKFRRRSNLENAQQLSTLAALSLTAWLRRYLCR